jgi:hypothetical protein
MVVIHTYADDGIYVSKLTTNVSQPGGSLTREFAKVRVRNVPPHVIVGPDMVVNEGQEVEYIANFTDQEWPDKHRAYFNFGDDSMPAEGSVTETNVAPQAQGSARAKHAYCREGDYTVTVKVIDDDGGVGMASFHVKAKNVPPVVEAGDEMFAYICTPITLVGRFTDPGWCDKHKGYWSFGDCTAALPALVREINQPPAATGIVAATHVYNQCGSFLAECTVVDDSGGVGHDATVVRVTGLLNGDFEGGFHVRPEGTVANHWVPYAAGGAPVGTSYLPAAGGGGASFEAEEFVVHDGQRSQKAIASAGSSAGILQPFGANVGWDYQVSAWFHLLGEGKCRLGIDPSGGTDPASSEIAWSEGSPTGYWMLLAGRVTAKRRAVTVFLEVSATTKLTTAWFDGAAIVVTPCELTARPSRPPAKDEEKCVNWRDEKAGQKGKEFTESGFTFKASNTLQVVTYGEPPGEGKLRIPISTLEVALPFEASRVVAHVVQNTGRFVEMKAMDASGQAVGQASSSGARGKVEALEIDAAGMVSLQFTSGGEDTLVDLCAYRRPPVQAKTPTIVGGEARPVLTLSVAGEPVGMQRDGGGNGTENDSGGCGCGNR